MRASFVMSGVAAGIRRNAAMTIALVLSTSIALGFVGAAILASTEINRFRMKYEDKLDISVYLCTNNARAVQAANNLEAEQAHKPTIPVTCDPGQVTSDVETASIRSQLLADPRVRSIKYISQAKELSLAKQQQPSLARYLELGDFPASFVVKLHDIQKDYPGFAAKFSTVHGVDQVANQIATIDTLLSIIDGARLFSIVVASVVLAASILLIANTIQVAAAQRKNETSIMRLVGASRWMTELPFILETVIATAIGGLVAIGFIWIGKYFVLGNVLATPTRNGVIPNLTINDVLVSGGAGLIVGVVLSALTAFATLRLYVRL